MRWKNSAAETLNGCLEWTNATQEVRQIGSADRESKCSAVPSKVERLSSQIWKYGKDNLHTSGLACDEIRQTKVTEQ